MVDFDEACSLGFIMDQKTIISLKQLFLLANIGSPIIKTNEKRVNQPKIKADPISKWIIINHRKAFNYFVFFTINAFYLIEFLIINS